MHPLLVLLITLWWLFKYVKLQQQGVYLFKTYNRRGLDWFFTYNIDRHKGTTSSCKVCRTALQMIAEMYKTFDLYLLCYGQCICTKHVQKMISPATNCSYLKCRIVNFSRTGSNKRTEYIFTLQFSYYIWRLKTSAYDMTSPLSYN